MAVSRSTTRSTRSTAAPASAPARTVKPVVAKPVVAKPVVAKPAVTKAVAAEVVRPAARPARRQPRAVRPVVPVALGSLTQPGARDGGGCVSCGSSRVTSLTLTLTDGTPVSFTSCHTCEHRSWVGPDGSLDRQSVLDRTRKVR